MSVFLKNDCSYCKKSFVNLSDLIIHIEREHLDFDPSKLQQLEEEKPECVPLSYIQRFSKPEDPNPIPIQQECWLAPTVDANSNEIPLLTNMNKFNPNLFSANEYKEKRINPIKANDLKLKEEFSFDLLGHMNNKLFTQDDNHKKPFACNMPGCQKRYKNINGIKYHYKNYHKFSSSTTYKRVKKSPIPATVPLPPTSSAMAMYKPPTDYHEMPLLPFKPPPFPKDMVYHGYGYEEHDMNRPPIDYRFTPPCMPPNYMEYPYPHQVPLPNYDINTFGNNSRVDEDFSGINRIMTYDNETSLH